MSGTGRSPGTTICAAHRAPLRCPRRANHHRRRATGNSQQERDEQRTKRGFARDVTQDAQRHPWLSTCLYRAANSINWVHHATECFQACRVAPLRILEDHENGAGARQGFQLYAECLQRLLPTLFGNKLQSANFAFRREGPRFRRVRTGFTESNMTAIACVLSATSTACA